MTKNQNAINKLVDWFELYLRNRDIILKKIISLSKKENIIRVEFKDKLQTYFVYLNSSDINLDILRKEQNPSLVLLNSEGNFSHVLSDWSRLITIPKLSIFFVNPFSETDKRWTIYPYTHHQISENDSLAKGLRALFESVESIDEESYSMKV